MPLDFDRIRYILTPEELENKTVLVVGLGSGGAPVTQHLTMNGVKNWILYDMDDYEEVNMVKHPGMRAYLGKKKVEMMKDWILDRNPEASVTAYDENILTSSSFENEVKRADLVVAAPDTQGVRMKINNACVEHQTPCVFGRVFRTGLGGDIFAYIPNESGCYSCLTIVGMKHGMDRIEEVIPMTEDEKEKVYGLGMKQYRASGLSMDISLITALHAKVALAWLFDEPPPMLQAERKANYIVFYIREIDLGSEKINPLSSRRFNIVPQKECYCSRREEGEVKEPDE